MVDKIIETVVRTSPPGSVVITTVRWTIDGAPEPRDEWVARHNEARNTYLNPPAPPV